MDAIRSVIEWIATDSPKFLFDIFPYAVVGLIGLYILWLVIGYLRVSQVGIRAEAAIQPVHRLVTAPDGVVEAPRGVPYCPVDGLEYPTGARFCTQCESELRVSCANCGATVRAADESCYRCGTRSTMLAPAIPGQG
jgi:Double zinc ribbon